MEKTAEKTNSNPNGTRAAAERDISAKSEDKEAEQIPQIQFKFHDGRASSSDLVQPKLTIGQSNDKYEKEADRVADKVMSMPESGLQRQTLAEEEPLQSKGLADQITPLVQRQVEDEEEPIQTKYGECEQEEKLQLQEEKIQPMSVLQRQVEEEEEPVQMKCSECEKEENLQRQKEEEEEPVQPKLIQKQPIEEEEEEQVQTKSNGTMGKISSDLQSRLSSSKGRGSRMPEPTNQFMSRAFGGDFSKTRIHTDNHAVNMNRDLHAKAFTHGWDIYFNKGNFNPDYSAGKRLLAHELTHVVQQNKGQFSKGNQQNNVDILRRSPNADTKALTENRLKNDFNLAYDGIFVSLKGDINLAEILKQSTSFAATNLGLDAAQKKNALDAAGDIPTIVREFEINGNLKKYNLLTGLSALYDLLPSTDSKLDQTNFLGFEYILKRVYAHTSTYVAAMVYEEMGMADPDLPLPKNASSDAWNSMEYDIDRIIKALGSTKSLYMLELEGTVDELVALQQAYNSLTSNAERSTNAVKRGEVARRALLINDQTLKMVDYNVQSTPLDTSVSKRLTAINKAAQTESDTRKELGDKKSLLAAQPLNLAGRVDDPYFKESGLASQASASQIMPQKSFPEQTRRFLRDANLEIQNRIKDQTSHLENVLSKIAPDDKTATYKLDEFCKVYKHWNSLFSVEQEKEEMKDAIKLWDGFHKITGMYAMYMNAPMGFLRLKLMDDMARQFGFNLRIGLSGDFQSVANRPALSPKSKIEGMGASDARYRTAELYMQGRSRAKLTRSHGSEVQTRSTLLSQRSQQTADDFTRLSKYPAPLRTPMAISKGLIKQVAPIKGLRSVEAKEGWSYLVKIVDPKSSKVVGHEHKIATPEMSEFLLAYRQHQRTLLPHMKKAKVRNPTKDSYTIAYRKQLEIKPSKTRMAKVPAGGISSTAGLGKVQTHLLKYLNDYFEKADPALRVIAIFHMMDKEHGTGAVLTKMLEPAEIAKVIAKSLAISTGLGVLSAFGPIGGAISMGLGKGMKMMGGNDIAAAMSVGYFFYKASEVASFFDARLMGYIGVPIVQDIKQLFEAALSAPAAKVGDVVGKAGVRAVQSRLATKPPKTIAEAAEMARMLPPEARQETLRAVNKYIADKRAMGAGIFKTDHDYDMVVSFRNALLMKSTKDQKLDPFTTPLIGQGRMSSKLTPHSYFPSMRIRTAKELATLKDGLGSLKGKVEVIEDPTMKGEASGSVRVYYSGRKVRVHVGAKATARDIKYHIPVIKNLRRYEGIKGRIRLLIEEVKIAIGVMSESSRRGTRGREAKDEIDKLGRIRDQLLASEKAINSNSKRIVDKEMSVTQIRKHIAEVDAQIMAHSRHLASVQTGRGYIAAERGSHKMAESLVKKHNLPTPKGHVWAYDKRFKHNLRLDFLGKGKRQIVDDNVLGRWLAGDPSVKHNDLFSSRSVAKSPGAAKAESLGLSNADLPAGHHWQRTRSGNLGLVRTDKTKSKHWFDYKGYAQKGGNPSDYIRKITSGVYSVHRPTKGKPRVVIRAWLGPSQRRLGLEKQMASAAKYGIKQIVGWERAHSTGAGIAAESGAAIRLAPKVVNQVLQNKGVEQAIRDIVSIAPKDARIHLETVTETHPGTLRLKNIHYAVSYAQAGEAKIQVMFRVNIAVTKDGAATPSVALAGSDVYVSGPKTK